MPLERERLNISDRGLSSNPCSVEGRKLQEGRLLLSRALQNKPSRDCSLQGARKLLGLLAGCRQAQGAAQPSSRRLSARWGESEPGERWWHRVPASSLFSMESCIIVTQLD